MYRDGGLSEIVIWRQVVGSMTRRVLIVLAITVVVGLSTAFDVMGCHQIGYFETEQLNVDFETTLDPYGCDFLDEVLDCVFNCAGSLRLISRLRRQRHPLHRCG